MISVKDVCKTYGKGDNLFTALYNVSAEIADGSTVAIIGKSGSGKSTLMHVMSGLDTVSSGEIVVNNKSLVGLKPKQIDAFRSKEMSFIFQSFFVEANQSCYQNVMLPLEIARVARRDRRKNVLLALKSVGLEDKVDSLAKNLSGGQKQRVSIARALIKNPEILLLDDCLSAVDTETEETILTNLLEYCKNKTTIIVSNRVSSAKNADTIIIIEDGEIIQQGSHNQLVNQDGYYKELYLKQLSEKDLS
jgi:ABC-type lipoprotein export system ATPase subunit